MGPDHSGLDAQHEMLLLALDGRLHTLPTAFLEGTSKKMIVLDVGTGSGRWAVELARKHKLSQVYGIDLLQVNPPDIPFNVIFETVDVFHVPFNTGTFNFVHARLLSGGIKDWKTYVDNLFRITKRGGYTECAEMDLQTYSHGIPSGQAIETWFANIVKMYDASKLDPYAAGKLKQRMQDSGYIDVHETIVEIPIGSWHQDTKWREIGRLALSFLKSSVTPVLGQVFKGRAVYGKTTNDMLTSLFDEYEDPSLRPYWKWHFVTGKKRADF